MLHTFSKLLRITSLLIRLAVLLAMFQLVGANSKTLLVAADNCYVNTKIVGGEDARCSVLEIDRRLFPKKKCTPIVSTLFLAPPRLPSVHAKLLVMTIANTKGSPTFKYGFVDIPLPRNHSYHSDNNNNNVNTIAEIQLKNLRWLHHYNRLSDMSDLNGFLYDHINNHLYLIFRSAGRLVCDVYLLNVDGNNFNTYRAMFLYNLDVHESFNHTKWSTNPYRQMFYYQKENLIEGSVVTDLFAMAFPEFIWSLKSGHPGTHIGRFMATFTKVQVIDSLIYMATRDYPLFMPLNRTSAMETCMGERQHMVDEVFVLSGLEYCKIRDGVLSNQTRCLLEMNPIGRSSDFAIQWNHIVIVIVILFLTALAVVLFVIRCRIVSARGIRRQSKFSSFVLTRDVDSFDNTL